jgi:DNA gyrase subunit A
MADSVSYTAIFQEAIELLKAKVALKAVALVGSRARGDDVDSSDCDLVLVADFGTLRPTASKLLRQAGYKHDITVDVFDYTQEELEHLFSQLATEDVQDQKTFVEHAFAIVEGSILFGNEFLKPYQQQYSELIRSGKIKPPPSYTQIPDVRDGLNTGQRRLLYTISRLTSKDRTKYRKSARLVNGCYDEFHPFGRGFLYRTLVAWGQSWSTRYPLIDGQGNFGSINPDPPAGLRYTEARVSKIGHEMLADLLNDTADFIPAFSESSSEPLCLPVRVPNAMINGTHDFRTRSKPIAPPYNLNEISDAIIAVIENPALTQERLLEIVRGPDFPTGGTLKDSREIAAIIGSGKGSLTIRGKCEIVDVGKRKHIVITELPFKVGLQEVADAMVEGIKSNKIKGVFDLQDLSTREGIALTAILETGVDPVSVILNFFESTPLQTTLQCESKFIVEGVVKVVPLLEMINHFIAYRQQVILRRARFMLKKLEDRLSVIRSLKLASEKFERVVDVLRQSESSEDAVHRLQSEFGWNEVQCRHVLSEGLPSLTIEFGAALIDEARECDVRIEEYKSILENRISTLEIVKREMETLKQNFGDARRTTVTSATT